MIYILINNKSKNGHSQKVIDSVKSLFEGKETEVVDVIAMGSDYKPFVDKLDASDACILVGGDGTLNRFANYVYGLSLPCPVYFYSAGTGNDFKNDMIDHVKNDLIYLNDVVENLPYAIINDKKYYFVNDIGFGIDGYCCEVGDDLQAKKPGKPISYTKIALKGVFGGYKCPNAKVTVDGVTTEYKKVWMAPAMKGKYFGSGMKCAPDQDRFNPEHLITSVVVHKIGRLKLLTLFSSIFKGTHPKYKKYVDIKLAHDIYVEFDRPTALQVDGETIRNVLKYEAHIK